MTEEELKQLRGRWQHQQELAAALKSTLQGAADRISSADTRPHKRHAIQRVYGLCACMVLSTIACLVLGGRHNDTAMQTAHWGLALLTIVTAAVFMAMAKRMWVQKNISALRQAFAFGLTLLVASVACACAPVQGDKYEVDNVAVQSATAKVNLLFEP